MQPPASNEFEAVFFGPGVGECTLMHLGNGDWVVIDSCLCPVTKKPTAISYLEAIGLDPSKSIKQVLATHWHDDHVRGISDILRICPQARFAMSTALRSDQFYQLVFEVDKLNKRVSSTSTASEFADIFEQIIDQTQRGPEFAHEGSILFRGGFKGIAVVQAISPSHATITHTQRSNITSLLTDQKTQCFKKFTPNDLSVAAIVSVGHFHLLFGADLENSNNPSCGWGAVVASNSRPQIIADVFKIPHHGSKNGHNNAVWTTMLSASPIAVVTSFTKQRTPLPTESDISRILGLTKSLYSPSCPATPKPHRRGGVDLMVRAATRARHVISDKQGFVKLRIDLSNTKSLPTITLSGSATKIS